MKRKSIISGIRSSLASGTIMTRRPWSRNMRAKLEAYMKIVSRHERGTGCTLIAFSRPKRGFRCRAEQEDSLR